MPLDIEPFDAAAYLHNEEDVAEYLALAMGEAQSSPRLMGHSIAVASRARGGMAMLAQETGIDLAELQHVVSVSDAGALPTLQRIQQAYELLAQKRLVA